MEEELISKKELLEFTGISYGQLYRWKRKDLIPEDWFIRKSTFTGQETFFPKAKMLARVRKIISLKEDASLSELKDVFSPSLTGAELTAEELAERGIVPPRAASLYREVHPGGAALKFNGILCLYVFSKVLSDGILSLDEAKTVLTLMEGRYAQFENRGCELLACRKMGVFTCFLVPKPCEVVFENGLKTVFHADITGYIEELKLIFSRTEDKFKGGVRNG